MSKNRAKNGKRNGKRDKNKICNHKMQNRGSPLLYDSFKAKIMLEKEGCIVCYPSRNCYSDIQTVLDDIDLMQVIAAYSVDTVIFRGPRDNFFDPVGACNGHFRKEKALGR